MNAANTSGESTGFVKFMLEVIRDILTKLAENEIVQINNSMETAFMTWKA